MLQKIIWPQTSMFSIGLGQENKHRTCIFNLDIYGYFKMPAKTYTFKEKAIELLEDGAKNSSSLTQHAHYLRPPQQKLLLGI